MREVLRRGPVTLVAIAGELNHPNVDSLDRIAPRQKNVFMKITGKDGITRIALGRKVGILTGRLSGCAAA